MKHQLHPRDHSLTWSISHQQQTKRPFWLWSQRACMWNLHAGANSTLWEYVSIDTSVFHPSSDLNPFPGSSKSSAKLMSKVYTPTPRVLSHCHSFLTNSPNKKTLKLKARNSIQNSRRQCLGTRVPKPAAAIKSCTKRSWIGFCQKSTKHIQNCPCHQNRAKGNTTISIHYIWLTSITDITVSPFWARFFFHPYEYLIVHRDPRPGPWTSRCRKGCDQNIVAYLGNMSSVRDGDTTWTANISKITYPRCSHMIKHVPNEPPSLPSSSIGVMQLRLGI